MRSHKRVFTFVFGLSLTICTLINPQALIAQSASAGVLGDKVGYDESYVVKVAASSVSSPQGIFRLLYQTPSKTNYLSAHPAWTLGLSQDLFVVGSTEELLQKTDTDGVEKRGPTISIEQAIAELVAEQPLRRYERALSFGAPQLVEGSSATNGRKVFQAFCGDCHGADGSGPFAEFNNGGKGLGPYGSTQPYLYLKVLPLNRWFAGGTTPEFAERSAFGVHATIPDMSGAATLTQDDWADIQAYVAQFDEPTRP